MPTTIEYCHTGQLDLKLLNPSIKCYWEFRSEFTFSDELLVRGHRVVIPEPLQKEVLHKFHGGHQGITHCHSRADFCMVAWSHTATKSSFKIVHNVLEITNLKQRAIHIIHPSKLPMATSDYRLIST